MGILYFTRNLEGYGNAFAIKNILLVVEVDFDTAILSINIKKIRSLCAKNVMHSARRLKCVISTQEFESGDNFTS